MSGKVVDATLRFVDKFTSPMNNAIKTMERSTKQAKKMGNEIKAAGKKISNVGASLTTCITAPILAIGAAAIKTSADFEAEMSRVQAIAEASSSDLELLKQQAIDLGASSVYSASEVATGMENMASAGFTTSEIMASMGGMLNLAASSGEDLATSAEIATSTVRGFGLEASETAHVADVLAQTAAKTNAAVVDTGEAMKYAAPVANTLGISLEETAAAIGIMSNAGIKGSQAGTTIRGALTRLVKPTKQVAEGMEQLGVKFFDTNGKMKSLADITSELQKKTKGLTSEEKNSALARIFGTEALSGMLSLVNATPGELSTLTTSLENSDGAAQKMADTMMNNTKGAIEQMKGSIETAGIVVGNIFNPYIAKAAKKIAEITSKFTGLTDEQQKTILKIIGVVAAVGPAIFIIGKLTIVIGVLINAFKVAKVATSLFGAKGLLMLINPAGIVVAIIIAIAIAAFLIIKNWNKVKEFFSKLGSTIKSVFKSSGGDASKFGKTFEKVKTNISKIVSNLKIIFSQIVKFMKPVITFIVNVYANCFKVYMAMIGGYVSALVNGITEYMSGIITIFDGITTFISGVFTGNWSKALEGLKTIFKGVFESLEALVKTPLNAVIGLINGAISGINSLGLTIPDWVPILGGKSFSINVPTIPMLYKGTNNWQGGTAMIHDKGAEIVDLPSGSRVYPHDKSIQMARAEGASSKGNININIAKLADKIEVRNDKDIDKIVEKIADKLEKIWNNTGKVVPA